MLDYLIPALVAQVSTIVLFMYIYYSLYNLLANSSILEDIESSDDKDE